MNKGLKLWFVIWQGQEWGASHRRQRCGARLWGSFFCQPCPAGFGRRDFPHSVHCSLVQQSMCWWSTEHSAWLCADSFQLLLLAFRLKTWGIRTFLDWLWFYPSLFRDLSLVGKKGQCRWWHSGAGSEGTRPLRRRGCLFKPARHSMWGYTWNPLESNC